MQTEAALRRFERTGEPVQGTTAEDDAGNGSLMRLAPAVLFALGDPTQVEHLAREQGRVTHGAPQCLDACALLATILHEAILGQPDPLRPRQIEAHPAIQAIAAGAYRTKTRDEIRSGGYVADTLEAALWAVHTASSFEDALTLAVNLGQDADTVGAVTGQLAGAMYGYSAIPSRWSATLAWREKICATTFQLLHLASLQPLSRMRSG